VAPAKIKASFIEPMLLLRSESLPDDPNWQVELKLDGYRALAIKTGGQVQLRSRNNNDFRERFPAVVKGLSAMPDESVVDGEIVALDDSGRPSFNTLQNYGSTTTPVFFYVFDLLVLSGRDVMREPLESRRKLLETKVLSKLREPVRQSPVLEGTLLGLVQSVREQNLEGLVAKRRDSIYEPGQRSGAWRKMRVNKGQEFVIGGYTPSPKNFDALIFGYYEGDRLLYAARTRNGFTPRSRDQLFQRLQKLETQKCPFANLPEPRSGRWGQGLTATKMKECRWLRPVLVGQFEFVEWTPDNHLRHSRFIAIREDKNAREVIREG
jgi:DNA ligase D-like protein (predicted ligase)